jgi:GNAT superfamily N-acetyltransferase
MVTARVIGFDDLLALGALDLARAHQAELEPHLSALPAPRLQAYRTLDSVNALLCLAVCDGSALVGYVIATLAPHPHYGDPYAYCDLLYLAPEHRRGSAGLSLLRRVSDEARRRGCRWVAWTAKPGSTLERLLSLRGCPVEEVIYREDLGWDSAAAA